MTGAGGRAPCGNATGFDKQDFAGRHGQDRDRQRRPARTGEGLGKQLSGARSGQDGPGAVLVFPDDLNFSLQHRAQALGRLSGP